MAGREQKVGEGRIIFSHPVVWPWCLKVREKKRTTTHLSDLWAPAGPGEAEYTDISQHFPVHGLRGYVDSQVQGCLFHFLVLIYVSQ